MKKLLAILAIIAVLCMVGATFVGCGEEDTTVLSADGNWRYKEVEETITVKTQDEVGVKEAAGYVVVESGKKITLKRTYYSLVSYVGTDANVVVPAVVDGHTVEAVESGLFLHTNNTSRRLRGVYDVNTVVKTVTFLCNIKELPSMAFYLCENLSSVVLPAGLEKVGDFCFYGCKSLTSIVLPEGVTYIGEYCFRECGALQTVYINNAATDEFPPYIGAKCFYMLNEKSSGDDQFYIIPDLKIYVKHGAVFEADYIQQAFKDNKNNDYRNWLDYVGENGIVSAFVG